jgi:hypothetical protein
MLALVTISSFLSPGQTIDESVTQVMQYAVHAFFALVILIYQQVGYVCSIV